jgi:hypothetical protein
MFKIPRALKSYTRPRGFKQGPNSSHLCSQGSRLEEYNHSLSTTAEAEFLGVFGLKL